MLILVVLAWPAIALAQSVPPDLPTPLHVRERVIVVDKDGLWTRRRVAATISNSVPLERKKILTDIPAERIARIDRVDGVRNGVFVGMAFGAASGLLGGLNDPQGRGRRAEFVAIDVALQSLIWGGIGALIDSAVRARIYHRGRPPSVKVLPLLTARVRGASLAVGW